MPQTFCSSNVTKGGRPFVKAQESAGHLSSGIGYPHPIEVPFSCPPRRSSANMRNAISIVSFPEYAAERPLKNKTSHHSPELDWMMRQNTWSDHPRPLSGICIGTSGRCQIISQQTDSGLFHNRPAQVKPRDHSHRRPMVVMRTGSFNK
ncbi:hypothetical protein EJ110_NYTH08484 [Nymphaea thermarum]|nr:hypothetical protein EJ110_NYTH08484 [Nymphaea thermarum]